MSRSSRPAFAAGADEGAAAGRWAEPSRIGLAGPANRALAGAGRWLSRHQGAIRALQWGVVVLYGILVAVPAFLPLPGRTAHLWTDLTLLAQFLFWGVWWPFVLLSMMLVGRSWCGLLCPEGALTEIASRWSLGRHLPRWLTWRGWPFVAFCFTTLYGQLVSVYQYPKPVLVILGGSTLAAIAVGLVWGRDKRVWCRYLCPVNGVFSALAKVSPIAFQVDQGAWRASQRSGVARETARPRPVNCAPLVPIRTMASASGCHMCGRCQDFRGAVTLSLRSPNREIVQASGDCPNPWESALVLFGMMGLALGAFQWTSSPWFVALKQGLAEWLVERGTAWPLERTAPWWILTDYPEQNDVMTLLDGAVLVAYVAGTAIAVGAVLSLLVALATAALGPWSASRFHHLVQCLIPLAACGVFLGLFSLTTSMLKTEGVPFGWLPAFRALMLAGAGTWSVWLVWQVAGRYASGLRRAAAAMSGALAAGVSIFGWALIFFVW